MKVTFTKKLHNNKTLRFIDIITTDNGMDNDKHATIIYIPTLREYITVDYNRGINTDIIVGIRYVANSHISLASTVLLDFSNNDDDTYYHFTDTSNTYYNFSNDAVPIEYSQFINKLMTIMSIYN